MTDNQQNNKLFDYSAAIARLEKIAACVEDPSTGLDDIDRYVRESTTLIEQCRAYLRGVRDNSDQL